MKYKRNFQHTDAANSEPKTPAPRMSSGGPRVNARPSQDEIATKAYFIYLQEGRPQGQDVQHWLEAEAQTIGDLHDAPGHGEFNEHANVDRSTTGNFEPTVMV